MMRYDDPAERHALGPLDCPRAGYVDGKCQSCGRYEHAKEICPLGSAVREQDAREVLQYLQNVVSAWSSARNLHARVGAGHLDGEVGCLSLRIEIFGSEQNGAARTPEGVAFRKTPPKPLKASDWGCNFQHGGKMYMVVGYKTQGAPRSVVCKRQDDGVEIRFTPDMVHKKLSEMET